MIDTHAGVNTQHIVVHEHRFDFLGFLDPSTALGVHLFVASMRGMAAPFELRQPFKIFIIHKCLFSGR